MTLYDLYCKRWSDHYNCVDFICDFYLHFNRSCMAKECRLAFGGGGDSSGMDIVDRPEQWCCVVMTSPRSVPHVGVYYDNAVIQLTEFNVSYSQINDATRGYLNVSFYKKRN